MAKSNTSSHAPPGDIALYVLAYVIALLAAIGVGCLFRERHVLLMLFMADIAGTLVIYLAGRIFRNASLYDAYWSVAPLVIALFWVLRGSDMSLRQVIVFALVYAWGLRLTWNWARQWRGVKHEDWRYQDLRAKTGRWFWLVDLIGIELMPTLLVFLGCLSLYPVFTAGDSPFGALDVIALVITLGAVLIETIADEQLRAFIKKRARPEEIMAEGLWAYSRHPNYLGEIAFWWGLFIFALAADAGYWWVIAGPAAITALFTCISIPMMDRRNLARRPGYEEHRKRVSPLLPWFPRAH